MKVTNPGKEKMSKPIKRKQIINEKQNKTKQSKTKQKQNKPKKQKNKQKKSQQQPKTKNQPENWLWEENQKTRARLSKKGDVKMK